MARWAAMQADCGCGCMAAVTCPRSEARWLAWRDIFVQRYCLPIYFWLRTHNLLARAGIHFNRFTECPPGYTVDRTLSTFD